MNEAELFIVNSVLVLETSHDFNKYIYKLYTRAVSVLLIVTGGFIFTFSDGSELKADSFGFEVLES